MTLANKSKINQLLTTIPVGTVFTSSYLLSRGYSHALLYHYVRSGWLRSIGSGAYVREGDEVDIFGGLYGLHDTTTFDIHIGGRSALQLLGRAQYLEEKLSRLILFAPTNTQLPKWFREHSWETSFLLHTSKFLPEQLEIEDYTVKQFTVSISSAARAMLECCYLAPNHQELSECYECMEGLNNLHPAIVQSLLEQCRSIKAKRLFLFLADHFQHVWFEFLDLRAVNLGKGKRQIATIDSKYDAKYQITVPKEWFRDA